MATPEIEGFIAKLVKRGFHRDDAYSHECAKCKERAVAVYALHGTRKGSRDIELCLACGNARAWSRRGIHSEREEDKNFDLAAFLA